jgi:hypothetical protein
VITPYHNALVFFISIGRTAALGGHVDACDECDYTRISYNSCRNRHCPKCQTLNKERWIEARKDDLLNVGYFHVVFTIPDNLNPLAYQNPIPWSIPLSFVFAFSVERTDMGLIFT